MVNINLPFHPVVAEYIRVTAVMQLNLEVMQHSCILGEDEYAFYNKIRFFFWLPFLLFGTLGLLGIFIYLMPHTPSLMRHTSSLMRHTSRLMRHTSSFETDTADSPSVMKGERIRAQMLSAGCGLFNVLYAPTDYSGRLLCFRALGRAAVGQLPAEHDADTPP
jgi:hypothetical protein